MKNQLSLIELTSQKEFSRPVNYVEKRGLPRPLVLQSFWYLWHEFYPDILLYRYRMNDLIFRSIRTYFVHSVVCCWWMTWLIITKELINLFLQSPKFCNSYDYFIINISWNCFLMFLVSTSNWLHFFVYI